uniref:NADH dehydrogenase subunit 5 n=1 Tax=Leucauge wulingensis TaxID=2918496 RepID=UPI001FA6D161|nr:NADH dehydrogenase subunit 5 [Leucauge wulingensis]ULD67698.1 NADH dehydrogenase subunit 5 [Leucauge wulingensis]
MLMSFPFMILSLILIYKNMFISIEMNMLMMNSFNLKMSLIMDWFSSMFIFSVILISSLIMMYSMFYIPKNEHKQFSIILLMFMLSMIVLILSNNLLFMLLGWDGLGLSSYILVVYYQNPSSSASGTITILSNRIGDILILMSISMLMIISSWEFIMNEKFTLLIMLMIMIASCTKSAQFPFSTWLPAAMAAPTPISALVHSSTLVTAGVYLLIRTMNYLHPISSLTLMLISPFTALYASMSASWEQDMKKIIALSTLSQISMMMFAISLGSMNMAFLHLIIHAMFKSMMFLCAGILIHNSSYQDMRHIGSLMKNSPLTTTIMGMSTMSINGFTIYVSIFFKSSYYSNNNWKNMLSILSMMMIMSIGMTSMYSIRMIKLSLSNFIKSKSDSNWSFQNFSELPILIMAPTSMFMGTFMLWINNPCQLFLIPLKFKMFIIMSLISGILLSLSLNFKSKKFFNLSESAINLWFSHNLSTFPTLTLYNPINIMIKMDKTWKEVYGPNNLYKTMKINSKIPTKLSQSLMSLLLLMTFIPPTLIMFM